jgi:nicotinamide riboside transporter PnuC
MALRVGLLASALLCLMMMIPGVNYASVVWWLGAGYFSVWVYKRRTGQPLTVRGGAHMGWITGVLSCVLLSVLFGLIMAAIERAGGLGALKTQLHDLAIDQKTIDEAVKRLQNPLDIVTSLAGMFLMMMLFCAAGGALGAKILSKD